MPLSRDTPAMSPATHIMSDNTKAFASIARSQTHTTARKQGVSIRTHKSECIESSLTLTSHPLEAPCLKTC